MGDVFRNWMELSSLNEEKLITLLLVFEKCLKPTHFEAFFVSPDYLFWNDGFR